MDVKGTMLLNYVKLIRSNRGLGWDQYLKPEDWTIINGRVFSSSRYSYDSFRRIGYAVFKLIAKSNLEVARGFGRFNMQTLLKTYSTSLLAPDDPLASVKKLVLSKRAFIADDSESRLMESGEKWARVQIIMSSHETDHERTLAFCYQYAGHLEELIERAGGSNAKSQVEQKDRTCEVLVKWE